MSATILGSLEFATTLAGAKLILVMGHTECGAVKGACDAAQLGLLTATSVVLREMIDKGETGLVGAMYDVSSGRVIFYD